MSRLPCGVVWMGHLMRSVLGSPQHQLRGCEGGYGDPRHILSCKVEVVPQYRISDVILFTWDMEIVEVQVSLHEDICSTDEDAVISW